MASVNSEQIESVIASLRGIEAVKAVIGPMGVEEIHVIVSGGRSPKQVVRDIESILMARLNLPIDHKIVSVAQTEGFTKPLVQSRFLVVEVGLTVAGKEMEARVTLERDGEKFTCAQKRPYSAETQLRLVAEATAGAIEQGAPDLSISIDDIRALPSGDRTIVLSAIRLGGGRREESYVGAVIASHDLWRAAVTSTLDALNRRLTLNDM
ncbi:MAG: hypothetical protein KY468_09950 [Armatimonadetes bacterium]|nr:hypothetical protein [Armatimonadota bacterium]